MSSETIYQARLEIQEALTALERLGLRRDLAVELLHQDGKIDEWINTLMRLRDSMWNYNFEKKFILA